MQTIFAAKTSQFDAQDKMKITLNGKEILLAKIDGTYYAVDNKCTHMGGSLYDGKLEGTTIRCPRHGTAFDLTSGKAVQNGKMLMIKISPKDLKAYPVKVEETDLFISFD
jgi:3-phenylpropionate/trans-cinnamate dioxygenase ferredoxin subunit